jgi:hypothetical protein
MRDMTSSEVAVEKVTVFGETRGRGGYSLTPSRQSIRAQRLLYRVSHAKLRAKRSRISFSLSKSLFCPPHLIGTTLEALSVYFGAGVAVGAP